MSNIRANTISAANGTGPVALTKQQAAKAWINWNGESGSSIRDSFGVSGLVDHGTGNQTISFSSAFTNNDYAMAGMGGNNNTSLCCVTQPDNGFAASTTAVRHQTVYADGSVVDLQLVSTVYLGDLA